MGSRRDVCWDRVWTDTRIYSWVQLSGYTFELDDVNESDLLILIIIGDCSEVSIMII